jgi:hypothetical protein
MRARQFCRQQLPPLPVNPPHWSQGSQQSGGSLIHSPQYTSPHPLQQVALLCSHPFRPPLQHPTGVLQVPQL